jgi:signal recognition particle subunit SRP54
VAEGEDPKVALKRTAGLIDAMTPAERRDPSQIDRAAKSRIATAVGRTPDDVDQLLSQFATVRDLMRKLGEMGFWRRLKLVMGFGHPPG